MSVLAGWLLVWAVTVTVLLIVCNYHRQVWKKRDGAIK